MKFKRWDGDNSSLENKFFHFILIDKTKKSNLDLKLLAQPN